ncbi:MAG: hypothetical protein H6733_11340 [Alphaproteobacteria bacterium]|nr:hypothetical protein [Alphaproteobacteria bacterium]
MRCRPLGWAAFVVLCTPHAAWAQSESAVFSGLAHGSDASTPNYADYLSMQAPKLVGAQQLGDVGDSGELGYTVGIDLPPALLPPSVAVSYSSAALGAPNRVATGWSLSYGMQITRPSRAAEVGAYKDSPDTYMVTGGGLGGLLSYDTSLQGYAYYAGGGGVAFANYDANTDSWDVHSGGVTTHLISAWAHLPSAQQPTETRRWMVSTVSDAHGNTVDYAYVDGLIDTITFGHNATNPSNFPATGMVEFVWEAVPTDEVRVAFTEGTADVYDLRLGEIHVWSRKVASSNWATFTTYRFTYGHVEGMRSLDAVHLIGSDDVSELPVATFTYSTSDGTALEASEDAPFAPSYFGASYTFLMNHRSNQAAIALDDYRQYGYGVTRVLAGLRDVNGDGLPDVLKGVGGVQAYGQPISQPATLSTQLNTVCETLTTWGPRDDPGCFQEEGEATSVADLGDDYPVGNDDTDELGGLEISETMPAPNLGGTRIWPGARPFTATLTRRSLMDVNGDGRLDIVESGPPAGVWDPYATVDQDNIAPAGIYASLDTTEDYYDTGSTVISNQIKYFGWTVFLGQEDGSFSPTPSSAFAPFPYAGLSVSDPACTPELTGFHPAHGYHPHVLTMQDVTGDGLPDILYFPTNDWTSTKPEQVLVYPALHDPEIPSGAVPSSVTNLLPGWSNTPFVLADANDSTTASLYVELTSNWFERRVSATWYQDYLDQLSENTMPFEETWPSCVFDAVQQEAGFTDLNGDGLADFVRTDGSQTWKVFYGNTHGVEPVATTWSAPLDGLSRTHEGTEPANEFTNNPGMSAEVALQFEYSVYGRIALAPVSVGSMEVELLGGPYDPQHPAATFVQPYDNETNNHSWQETGFLDMDGDGLLDLVESTVDANGDPDQFRWWRNLGGSFSAERCQGTCAQRTWLSGGLHRSFTAGVGYGSASGGSGWDVRGSKSVYHDARAVQDLNNDGLPDLIEAPMDSTDTGHVLLSVYAKPGLLVQVDNEYGGHSDYAYSPSWQFPPVGDPYALQRSDAALDAVTEVQTWDEITSDGALVAYDYEGHACRSGACPGFERVVRTEYELQLGPMSGGRFTYTMDAYDNPVWLPRMSVDTTYLLTRDGAYPQSRLTFTDHQLAAVPYLGGSTPELKLRFQEEMTYGDVSKSVLTGGDFPACTEDVEGLPPICRAVSRRVSTYLEELLLPEITQHYQNLQQPVPGTTATMRVDYTWDDPTGSPGYRPLGLLEAVVICPVDTGTSCAVAPTDRTITWDASPTGGYAVPTMEVVSGPTGAGSGNFLEAIQYAYTTVGPWSKEIIGKTVDACPGGQLGCGDVLTWSWDRHPVRGQVNGLDGPLGSDFDVTEFRFGGVVPGKSYNALGHESLALVDDQGRVTTQRDPGGVGTNTIYDAFGRAVAVQKKGVGGQITTVSETTYYDGVYAVTGVPRMVRSVTKDELGNDASESWTVLDAFGRVRQNWKRAPAGLLGLGEATPPASPPEWVVNGTLTDLRGQARVMEHPYTSVSGPTTGDPILSSHDDVMTLTGYDALGSPRVVVADRVDDGFFDASCRSRNYYTGVFTLGSQDQSGRAKEQVTDALGRLIEVREGNPDFVADEACRPYLPFPVGGPVTIATYEYDGMGRLLSLVDADTNKYTYAYDLAGRMRRVVRSSGLGNASEEDYVNYDYVDGAPTVMYEGAVGPNQAAVTWDYDAIGRLVTKRVRPPDKDPDTNHWEAYSWVWDTRWVGAKSTEYAPTATTEFYYTGATAGSVGNLGRVSTTTRQFSGVSGVVAQSATYDLTGNILSTTLPSGAMVTNDHDLGWLLSESVTAAGLGTETLTHTYSSSNGTGTGWVALNTGHELSLTTQVGHVTSATWTLANNQGTMTESYAYGADHRLTHKAIGGVLASELNTSSLDYTYDTLGRVREVTTDLTTREHLEYDLLGRLTDFTQTPSATFGSPDRIWSYDPPGPYGEQPSRESTATSAGSFTEDYTYEPGTSRIIAYERVQAGMERLFEYDGTGQLVHLQQVDGGVKTLDVQYAHGMDDELLVRSYATVSPYTLVHEYHFGVWQLDRRPAGERIVETAMPSVRLVTNPSTGVMEREWVFKEIDGHAIAVMRDDGTRISTELMGAYGTTLEQTGSVYDQDRFHGMEMDGASELTRMGVRHLMMGDGRWLQPEPLLALGPRNLSAPRGLLGVYASGTPTLMSDRSGYATIGDVARSVFNVLGRIAGWIHSNGAAPAIQGVATTTAEITAERLACSSPGAACQTATEAVAEERASKAAAGRTPQGASTLDEAKEAAERAAVVAREMEQKALEEGGQTAMSRLGRGQCFVGSTNIMTPAAPARLEDIEPGSRAIGVELDGVGALCLPDGAVETPSTCTLGDEASRPAWVERVEVGSADTLRRADASSRRWAEALGTSWLTRACEGVKRTVRATLLPTALLAACDVGVPPSAAEVVEVYDVRTGAWYAAKAEDVSLGGELRHDGHLFRVDDTGMVDLGSVGVGALADADAAVTEVKQVTEPNGSSWVLVLADEGAAGGHARLSEVVPGARFAFQGRVYEASGGSRVEEARETGEVIGRVVNTFVRTADGAIDVDIAYPDGSVDTLTGTPNHPFWVPAVQDYVALEDLEVGTVLRTYGGAEATVLGLTWKPGEVEVYDIEVEGLHNFFVRGPGSDAPGVLVHNSTPKGSGPDFVVTEKGTAIPVPDGATGPVPAESGKGFQFTGGSGGKGMDDRVSDVRIMDPTEAKGGAPAYPDGYATYGNASGQKVDPATGKTVSNKDPAAHIPLTPPGK